MLLLELHGSPQSECLTLPPSIESRLLQCEHIASICVAAGHVNLSEAGSMGRCQVIASPLAMFGMRHVIMTKSI